MPNSPPSLIFIALAAFSAASCSPGTGGPSEAVRSSIDAAANATQPQSDARPRPFVMGGASCASSGCHGQPFDGQRRDWPASYAIWLHEDPHRRAFQVLYTERAIEMYRNLNPASKLSVEPPSDQHYLDFLNASCIGCHATGLLGRHPVATVEPGDGALYFLEGIGCESCHGPASVWLDSHYLTDFPRGTSGFHDTKPLAARAEACVGCHVGPMIAENGKPYDMNHDLIAAGHPRLAFEFSSYLANLPKHWNEKKDVARHRATDSVAFHSDAWAHGQEQAARQLARQLELRLAAAKRAPDASPWPDFANYQCLDCHHPIREPGIGAPAARGSAVQLGAPRPAIGPLDVLRIMSAAPGAEHAGASAAADKLESLLDASWRMPVSKLDQSSGDELAILTSRGQPPLFRAPPQDRPQQHASWLLALMETYKQPPSAGAERSGWRMTWDDARELYLAAAALGRDVETNQTGPLHSALAPLDASLRQASFRDLGRPATQYDSPAAFDPATADWERLEQVLKAINH